MNQFLEIQQQLQANRTEKKASQPPVNSINNLRKGKLTVPKHSIRLKKRYTFLLREEEHEQLTTLALQAGFKNQYGKGNASAFLSALIQELGGDM